MPGISLGFWVAKLHTTSPMMSTIFEYFWGSGLSISATKISLIFPWHFPGTRGTFSPAAPLQQLKEASLRRLH